MMEALQALARRQGPSEQGASLSAPMVAPDQNSEPTAGRGDEPEFAIAPARSRRRTLLAVALAVVSAAVGAALFLAVLDFSQDLKKRWSAHPSTGLNEQTLPSVVPTAPAEPAPVTPEPQRKNDVGWIEKAMADCDQEAARNPDALYFLIIPVMPASTDPKDWSPAAVGQVGRSVLLLKSKDMLDGLGNGSLALYGGRYTFSIIDPANGSGHVWSPGVGLAKLSKPDVGPLNAFSIAFALADGPPETQLGFKFLRDKGICYWVGALVHN